MKKKKRNKIPGANEDFGIKISNDDSKSESPENPRKSTASTKFPDAIRKSADVKPSQSKKEQIESPTRLERTFSHDKSSKSPEKTRLSLVEKRKEEEHA